MQDAIILSQKLGYKPPDKAHRHLFPCFYGVMASRLTKSAVESQASDWGSGKCRHSRANTMLDFHF